MVLGAGDAADGAPLVMLAATGIAPAGRFTAWRLVEEGGTKEEAEDDDSEGPHRFFGESESSLV
jgi:hypothetical protein